MSDVNIKDLINIPGAGRAEVALRAVGAWDDGRAPDAVEWQVTVYATVAARQTIVVRAVSSADAEKLARVRALDNPIWDFDTFGAEIDMAVASEVGR